MEIKPFDDESMWETFIEKYSPQSFFQSYLWGEVIKSSRPKADQPLAENKLWRFGIFEDTKLIGLMQVEKVVAKRGTFLHLRHGPVLIKWEKHILKDVLDFLKIFAKKENAWFIRISPLIENSEENKQLLSSFGFQLSPIHAMDGELCWVLDITKSEEELLSGMRKTTRYLVKQAVKQGVKIEESTDIEQFLRLYKETAVRQGFVPHQQIREEFEIFKKHNRALLLLGYYKQQLLSGAIVVFYGNQAIYRHGASLPSKIPVSYLLQWEAIKEAKKRGFRVYNFWGIAPQDKLNHPWKGITLFKKGFGGEEIHYLHAHDLPLSSLYKVNYIVESVRRIRKGY